MRQLGKQCCCGRPSCASLNGAEAVAVRRSGSLCAPPLMALIGRARQQDGFDRKGSRCWAIGGSNRVAAPNVTRSAYASIKADQTLARLCAPLLGLCRICISV